MRLRYWAIGSAVAAIIAAAVFGLTFLAVLGAFWAASIAATVTMLGRAAKAAVLASRQNAERAPLQRSVVSDAQSRGQVQLAA
jgi:hypothetical protein